ncbi:MAG: metal ABC transporter permease [Gammaproteobacteria bacterium]|nr:metal ABC transporter permease [Gammaproteobacteria bacterium]
MDSLFFLAPALVFCLLLVISHSYFGLHVLARGIIFIDLALAQIAALGLSIAFLLGYDSHSYVASVSAFTATLIAALLFSRLRFIKDKTSREITIGSVYVVATALSILILSRSVQGMEQLKSLLNGDVLWVSWTDVALTGILYAAVLLVHLIYRQRFYQLSFETSADNDSRWEVLFFVSFAVVITLAVTRAGILLVFAYLILPAFSASLATQNIKQRLFIAWPLSILATLLGLICAYQLDLPVGATLVACLGLLPLLILGYKGLTSRRKRMA